MKQEKKSGSNQKVIIGLVIVAVAVAGFILSAPLRRQRRARHDVKELLLGLRAYEMEFGKRPDGSLAQICAALRGQNPAQEAVVESYQINGAGEFVDPWGTPYQIDVKKQVRVLSFGPNRIDDQGEGDDILAK